MSYKKWNVALYDYFFKNEDDEIILYIDEEIINEIGDKNNLGNFNDFIDSIIVDFNGRIKIYDEIIDRYPKKGHEHIRSIKNNAGLINFSRLLGNPPAKPLIPIPFLNYVVLAIVAQTKSSNGKFYDPLNEIISSKLSDQQDISTWKDLDILFKKIHEHDLRFINRKIGINRYVGLIKYQVVLSNKENELFEQILFKNHIIVDSEVYFTDFFNKIIQSIPSESSLRKKIIAGVEERCNADWFINRASKFNHEKYLLKCESLGKEIPIVQETANFKLLIDFNEPDLKLLTDLNGVRNFENDEFSFYVDYERTDDGYSIHPINLKSGNQVDLKEYKLKSQDFVICSIPLRKVLFFQSIGNKRYLQTNTPKPNINTIVVVENEKNNLEKFEKWFGLPKNATNSSDKVISELTQLLFGDGYIVFKCSGINNQFYCNDEFITKTEYDASNFGLDIKTIGGKDKGVFKIGDLEKTYLDVALPAFEVSFPDFDSPKLEVSIYTIENSESKDSEKFEIKIENHIVKLKLRDNVILDNAIHIFVDFKYTESTNKIYESRKDFSVTPSLISNIEDSQLFKLNPWGEKTDSVDCFYNNVSLKGSDLTSLGRNKHEMNNLENEPRPFSDFFIQLLSARFYSTNKSSLNKTEIFQVIDISLDYFNLNSLNDEKFELNKDIYDKNSLISDLISLGYINKELDDNCESYQLNNPTLIQIEAKLVGINEVFKLVGGRTKLITQKIKLFCHSKNIELKYIHIPLINKRDIRNILPDTIVFSSANNFKDLIDFLKQDEIILNKEDVHNIGDSLLSFVASVIDFEDIFVKDNYDNVVDDSFFQVTNETIFPRIRTDKNCSGNFGDFHPKRLEVSKGKYVSKHNKLWLPLRWMESYVRFKRKELVMMLQTSDKNRKELSPKIYFYKYHKLSILLFKALVNLNNNLPKAVKIFIIDSSWSDQSKNYPYNDFLLFSISMKRKIPGEGPCMRRENLSKILTGKTNYIENESIHISCSLSEFNMQICFTSDTNSNYIVIKDNDNRLVAVINIISFKKRIYKVYVMAFLLKSNDKSINLSIEEKDFCVNEVGMSENINKTISLILKKDYTQLNAMTMKSVKNDITLGKPEHIENILIKR